MFLIKKVIKEDRIDLMNEFRQLAEVSHFNYSETFSRRDTKLTFDLNKALHKAGKFSYKGQTLMHHAIDRILKNK